MSIIRRMTIALSAMLALLVAVVGIGIGAVAGEHDLGGRVTVMLIVITAAALVALALGVTGTVFLNRSVKGRLEKAVGGIGAAASQILAVASQVAAAAAQTAAATNETTATVEEVKQTAILAQEKAVGGIGALSEGGRHLQVRRGIGHSQLLPFRAHPGRHGAGGRGHRPAERAGPVGRRHHRHGQRPGRAVEPAVGERVHRGRQSRRRTARASPWSPRRSRAWPSSRSRRSLRCGPC